MDMLNMKFLTIFVVLFTTNAYAWETSDCKGTQPQRIAALKQLGKFTQQYKSIHGSFPDPMFENNKDFNAGIPKELSNYSILKNDSPESIGFNCSLPLPEGKDGNTEELCFFLLASGKVECSNTFLKFESDSEPKH